MAGRGAGRSGGGRVQVRELSARPSEVFERHSLPGVRGERLGTNPRAWHFSGHRALPLPPAKPGRSARSRLQARESAAAASNPALSSLPACVTPGRRRGAERCACRCARRSPRGRGRQGEGEKGPESWGPVGTGATSR